ncbi:hypothetical protein BU25DRAFT_454288 [Macroventuria anomochaeta]|uniref:Uncharacterized protein n=1 Tax=Macroventuria anomochaeta TaxID=301207 RepID=A0ACB6SCG2_9PLEO|nr:uncharacterized protein BU25DRAFT_454288 [Macroventuria anomochaeta]KAF2631906.1 hypothetical protein BU25DRAFT_454288 [Macroventuria anomochaeta]
MDRFRSFTWPDGIAESDLKQKKVSQIIPVHAEYRRTTHRREGATLINSVYKDTGCIVVAHWDQSTIKRFDVFVGAGSKSATAAINKWIARGDEKSTDAAAWAKTPAFNHAQWYQEELERQEEERMEYFLGPEPESQEGEPVRVKITMSWPEDLFSHEVTPRVAFGNELQALNDIKKRDGVWMTLLPDHSVQISGFDIINVEAAEGHYKTMVERIRTEKCSLQQATNMVLDEREGIDVVLLRAESWWPNRFDTVIPRLLPSPIMDQPGSFQEDGLHDTQLVEIRDPIKRALEAVSYERGSYDFVVRLGCIALDSKKIGEDQVGKKHGKEKFIKSINGKVDLACKKWLLDNVLGTQLYHRLVKSNDFLEPIKSAGYWGTIPGSLEKTRPTLRGTWIFRDPNNAQKQALPPTRNVGRPAPMQQTPSPAAISTPSTLIVVQIDWTDDGEGSYDKTATKYYRLEPGKCGAKVNMDVNLLELGESRAWSFALESMTPISRSTVPPVLTGFAHRTVMTPGYDVASTQSFARWDQSPSVKALMLHGCLDKVYSFGVQKTCYKVELTAMWYPGQSLPCWGLAVRHTEWATHLAELERLQTGHQANWSDTIATFLPDDGGSSIRLEDDDFGAGNLDLDGDAERLPRVPSHEGIRTLTNILLRLSELVSSVTLRQGGIPI